MCRVHVLQVFTPSFKVHVHGHHGISPTILRYPTISITEYMCTVYLHVLVYIIYLYAYIHVLYNTRVVHKLISGYIFQFVERRAAGELLTSWGRRSTRGGRVSCSRARV